MHDFCTTRKATGGKREGFCDEQVDFETKLLYTSDVKSISDLKSLNVDAKINEEQAS